MHSCTHTTFFAKHASLLCLVLVILGAQNSATAQAVVDNARDRFGVYTEMLLNFHSANFKQLPNVDNCCPLFESGNGSGYAFGILYDLPMTKRWSVSMRADYEKQDATLIALESADAFDRALNVLTTANIEHRISTHLSSIGFSALAQVNPVAALRFQAGLRVAALSSVKYDQVEELQSSGFVFKENMLRTRNQKSGELSSVQSPQLAWMFGTSYEFALNTSRTWLLAPQMSLQLALNNISNGIDWKANAFRIGVALKFATPPMNIVRDTANVLPVKPAQKIVLTQNTSKAFDTAQHIELPSKPIVTQYNMVVQRRSAVTSLKAVDSITVEEYRSQRLMPLLNYVFFDEASDQIAARYRQIARKQSVGFHPSDVDLADGLSAYYQLLNIVGWRMQHSPKAQLKLVGCNADLGTEKGQSELSRRRAQSVKKYLCDVWSIDAARISIEARNLPLNASHTSDSLAASDAENRRVEISSSDVAIFEPLQSRDTLRHCEPDSLVVDVHRLSAKVDNSHFIQIESEDSPKQRMQLDTSERQRFQYPLRASRLEHSSWLSVELLSAHGANAHDTAASLIVPVVHHTLQQKQASGMHDTSIDNVRLILFDYDKAGLSAQNKHLLSFVQEHIHADSRVVVEGWTDELGDAEYNRRLSEERARQSASALNAKSLMVLGRGESREYPNAFPEGRFYNRTVSVTIYSPTVAP